MYNNKGLLIIISGPSGSGKGTVVNELIKDDKYSLSVSCTTRTPRKGEVEGINYYFKSREEFDKMVDNNEFLEYATFCENSYGTPKKYVEKMLEQGYNVILEIETYGALQVKQIYDDAVLIFLAPPNITELKNRLIGRDTEDIDVIQMRLNKALKELDVMKQYDYVVINDTVDESVNLINTVVNAEKLNTKRNKNLINIIKELD